MRRTVLQALILAVLATACGGTDTREIGVKEFATDILFGAERPAPPHPLPGVNPFPGFPSFIQPPPPVGPPAPPPPLDACPTADPLGSPRRPATVTVTDPPAEATYPFRNRGTFRSGDARGTYPAESQRRVEQVRRELGDGEGFTYDVVETFGTVTTRTTYRVTPRSVGSGAPTPREPTPPTPVPTPSSSPPAPPNAGRESGIFIVRVVTEGPDGVDTFTPSPAVLLLPLPAAPGVRFSSAGTDPLTQTTLALEGEVSGKTRVDACGTLLDAWNVEVAAGRIVGSRKDLRFTATYAMGTQYGGLSLRERVSLEGSDGGESVESVNLARISVEPKAPGGQAS